MYVNYLILHFYGMSKYIGCEPLGSSKWSRVFLIHRMTVRCEYHVLLKTVVHTCLLNSIVMCAKEISAEISKEFLFFKATVRQIWGIREFQDCS